MNNFIQVIQRDAQTFYDVQSFQGLFQVEFRSAADDFHLVVDVVDDDLL